MAILPAIVRGPLLMIASTLFYVINDTLMKLATTGLPPYEVLLLRGLSAAAWGFPLLAILGYRKHVAMIFERRVLVRSLFETFSILAYVVALANMQIANSTALMQITPLLVMGGAALVLCESVSGLRWALIVAGFAGAVMIVRPTLEGISVYALLAVGSAALGAARDLTGRRIGADIPGMIVAMSAVVTVLVGAGVGHVLFEHWVAPGTYELALLAAAGLFLVFGHFFLFMAYRTGPIHAVAPFYYCFTIWAIIAGLLVFGQFPNSLAIAGIALVLMSGLVIVLLDRRARRTAVTG